MTEKIMMNKNCVALDVDGTVSDPSHRLKYVKPGEKPDWTTFFSLMHLDTPKEDVIQLSQALSDGGMPVIVVSARPDDYKATTETWLFENGVQYDRIYMRASGDHRKDSIVKSEILEQMNKDGWYPWVWIDDRKQVIDAMRENGLTVADIAGDSREQIRGITHPKLWIMVGPSGSGKTSYVGRQIVEGWWKPRWVVSSDELRDDVCGDWTDQTQNTKVFEVLHQLVKERLRLGLNTIVDSTAIKNRDRKGLVALAPDDCDVRYVVVDRPLEEKVKTGGWRLNVMFGDQNLIEKHDTTFRSNIKEILRGDGLNVTVEDERVS